MTIDAKTSVHRPWNRLALTSLMIALLPLLLAAWLPLLRGQKLDMTINDNGLLALCVGVPVEIIAIVLGHLAIRADRLKSMRGGLLGATGLAIGYVAAMAIVTALILQALAVPVLIALLTLIFRVMGG